MKACVNVMCLFKFCRKYLSVSAAPVALRAKKKKSASYAKDVVDARLVAASGGTGGDGCISFLSLWANEFAGPDGGDGGNGGHVLFEVSTDVKGLDHVRSVLKADNGEKGYNKDCAGRNADHMVVKVPVGTIVKNNLGRIVADLKEEKMIFVAARGGAGGRGNHFFATDLRPSPEFAEIGATGEKFQYKLELSCIAHFGMLGFPNAGKSTLLQAVTRANPKVAPYPFTTLKPHLGTVQYDDHEQIIIADLPGLIEGSHLNKGLGISFLRHAERCMGLLIVLDMSEAEPWKYLNVLRNEILCFSRQLSTRPQIIVANKMDLPESAENLKLLKHRLPKEQIISISAKHGINLANFLTDLRVLYDEQMVRKEEQVAKDFEITKQEFT